MSATGDRIRADVSLLEGEITSLTGLMAARDAQIAVLTADLAACQDNTPVPPPDPVPVPPPTGAWVPPMKAIQVPYTWPTPDVILAAGESIRTAYNSGKRKIKLLPGSYGSQVLGTMPGAKIWCDTYRGAKFANGTGPFVLGSKDLVLGNLQIENYKMHISIQGGAMCVTDGSTGMWFINCATGKSINNAYSIKGSSGGIRGGEFYECGRYGWVGGGDDNIIEDVFFNSVGTGTTDNDSDRGVSKTTFSERHIVRRLCGINTGWNGVWFDIQNQPALIEDIFMDGVGRNVVFIEVSYGGDQQTGDWTKWRIRRIGGKNPTNQVRDGETNNPVPSVVRVSATPDVDIEDVYGDGWRCGVTLINPGDHKQITGEIGTADRTRMGLRNITVKRQVTTGNPMFTAALWGDAHTKFPNMKQPGDTLKWVDPVWPAGSKFRDFSGTLTEAQFRAKYV